MNERRKLTVMPAIEIPPGSAAILAPREGVAPVLNGHGDIDYECGSCGTLLIASIGERQIQQELFIRCPDCHALNRCEWVGEADG